jgi:hypothetical protein
MTPLGKMLAIFVFLLALVWAWLTVNTFVSRTNWKAEAEKFQKLAVASAEGADSIKREVDAERSATKAKLLAAERDRDAAIAKTRALADEVTQLKAGIDNKLTDAAKANPAIGADNSRQKELQAEVVNLTTSLGEAQKLMKTLTVETQAAKLAQEQAQRDAAAEKQRAGAMESQLRTTDDKLKDALARLKLGIGEGVAVRPTAPEGFRGTVKSVSGEFVEITPGGATGLRSGTKLKVSRLDGKNPLNSKFVGYVIVRDEIDPDKAAAQFVPPYRGLGAKALSADDYPKAGDVIEPEAK